MILFPALPEPASAEGLAFLALLFVVIAGMVAVGLILGKHL